MNRLRSIKVGVCSNGPVVLSFASSSEYKFVVSICNFDKFKDEKLICCKTTSKTEKVFPGEFILDDLFGRGKSKVQPYNVCRIHKNDISNHRYIGTLDDIHLNSFEQGIKIAIKKNYFTYTEMLNVLDSWQPFFS